MWKEYGTRPRPASLLQALLNHNRYRILAPKKMKFPAEKE